MECAVVYFEIEQMTGNNQLNGCGGFRTAEYLLAANVNRNSYYLDNTRLQMMPPGIRDEKLRRRCCLFVRR